MYWYHEGTTVEHRIPSFCGLRPGVVRSRPSFFVGGDCSGLPVSAGTIEKAQPMGYPMVNRQPFSTVVTLSVQAGSCPLPAVPFLRTLACLPAVLSAAAAEVVTLGVVRSRHVP